MNTEILEEFSASNDHIIVKGKRTKRPRPSSSASSSGGDLNSTSLLSSPTTTTTSSTSTNEDEDLANCLILLARGAHGPKTDRAQSKFSSRKFTETAAAPDGRAAIYVYECKTCCRSFPSFQALGGHRASHKKPKPAAADSDHKRSPPPPKKQQKEEDKEEAKFANLNTIPPPPSTQLLRHLENKPKIHECSICGSEFASGQALGGHMRRHRSGPNSSTPPPPAAVEVAAKSDDDSSSHDHHHRVVEKTRNMLSLDLNLPAPPEDDRREAEFRAFSSNQQPRLVFTAAALVDCHY